MRKHLDIFVDNFWIGFTEAMVSLFRFFRYAIPLALVGLGLGYLLAWRFL